MPLYDYMTDEGRIIEHLKPMAEADPIGALAEVPDPDDHGNVIEATRIPSPLNEWENNWKPYISERLPRHMAGQPCTPGGKPIITSRKQEREICARFSYQRE